MKIVKIIYFHLLHFARDYAFAYSHYSRVTNKRTTLLFRTFCYFKREEIKLSFSFEITKCPE